MIRIWERETRQGRDLKEIAKLCLADRYFLLVQVLRRKDCLHPWIFARCREVELAPDGHIDLWAREHYKALDVATPVWTPHGWVAHGELKPGDCVYAPDGRKVRVLANTGAMVGAECFQVGQVVAAGDHLWPHQRKIKRRVGGSERRRVEFKTEITRTADVNTLRLPPISPLEGTPLDPRLPHPYVLGVWLGDGSVGGTRITQGMGDAPMMEELLKACGTRVTIAEHTNAVSLRIGSGARGDRGSSDFANALTKLGIYRKKAVPHSYLTATAQERLALLQGMMDTDGSVDAGGTAVFVNVNETLADAVALLVRSLGWRASKRLHSVLYAGARRPFYQVSFQAYGGAWCPFRLPRKAARCLPGERTMRLYTPQPVASRPVNCIQVEGGLYLAGEQLLPTHNSTIITFAGIIQEILKNPEITIAIFSHNRGIAKGFLGQVKLELETNTLLQQCFPDVLYDAPQAHSPSWSEDGGIIVKRTGNPKEATLEAWGLVDGQPTSKHFALMVYDDVVTEKSVNTPEQIAKTTEAWSLSDNLGTTHGRKWHVGTRFHYADTYAEIIKRGAALPRIHPATHDGTLEGRPVLFSQALWDRKKRDQLETTVACQLLLNPLAGHQRMFDQADLQVYEARPETLMVYIMVDPARSKKKGSDNTAMAVVGISYDGRKYLLDGFAHKMDLMERWQRMRDLWRKWRQAPGVLGVKVGYERYGAIADLDYFNERKGQEQLDFEIEPLEWPAEGPGSKIDRVQRLTPDIRGHRLYIPYPTDMDNLTPLQVRMVAGGYEYRIAQKILRRDENGQTYDLAEQFKMEIHFFPYGGLKDLIDAVSRIYDMDPRPPEHIDSTILEPEYS